jgi:mannose-6-phosphate isomerase-like protein (cupin superfamily)
MRFATRGIVLVGAVFVADSAAAQNQPAAPAIVRTVVAGTKLAGVGVSPLYFRALAVTIPPGETSKVSGPDGILYQISGSTEIATGSSNSTIGPGEAVFVSGSGGELLKAAGAPSSTLHFLLSPAAMLDQPADAAPASVTELFRTAAPLPDLKPGAYAFNLTRVTFPPQMASNPPHYRSGAALYYILSGTGANTVDGKTVERGPGSLIYEPYGLVHQWGNPGNEPLTFLAFNINPEGIAAVLPGAPQK